MNDKKESNSKSQHILDVLDGKERTEPSKSNWGAVPQSEIDLANKLWAAGRKVVDADLHTQLVCIGILDFLGYLTSRDKVTTLSAHHDAGAAIEAYQDWIKIQGIDASILERANAVSSNNLTDFLHKVKPRES